MHSPPYSVYPVLSGSRVLLRRIEPSDMAGMVEITMYDSKQAETVDEAVAMLERVNQNYADGDTVHWGIEDGATKKIIGNCGYYRGFENETGELGCVLLPDFRGKGHMTEAMNLAIDFGFNQMKLRRIIALTTIQNTKAIRLLDRLKFKEVKEFGRDEVEYELLPKTQ